MLEIGRTPDVGRRVPNIIDPVPLIPPEHSNFRPQLRTNAPVDATLVTPGLLRPQVRRAHVRRIVIVEIGVTRKTEGTADAAANFDRRRHPIARTHSRTKL